MVEGASDERFLRLLLREGHWGMSLDRLDIWKVDAIDIPGSLTANHHLVGSGARQRVIAFIREVEAQSQTDGFRGVIDNDLDRLLDIDIRSQALLYTDYSCMEAYTWTTDALHALITQFHCEKKVSSSKAVNAIYRSIDATYMALAAFRRVMAEHPELEMHLHRSTKPLSLGKAGLHIDLSKYVEQSRPIKGGLASAQSLTENARVQLGKMMPRQILNGHDLVWLLTFVLGEMTALPVRLITAEIVGASLVAIGVSNKRVPEEPLFKRLEDWAGS